MATIPLSGRVGIYAIVNRINGKRYVGSSVDIQGRFGTHRRALLAGVHHSGHLQAAWNKYGRDAFDFEALLLCSRGTLLDYEQRCIDGLNPEYNICRDATSRLGIRNTPTQNAAIGAGNRGKKRTPEQLAAQSELGRQLAAQGLIKPPPPMSPEVKARVDAGKRGRKQPAEAVAKRAELARERMRDPQYKARALAVLDANREKARAAAKVALQRPEVRAATSARMQRAWADEAFRERVSSASREAQTHEWREKHAAGVARIQADPDYHARRNAGLRASLIKRNGK